MKSRVYWNCLMNETILVQELHLPPSGISRLEEQVPIPKFIGFTATGYGANRQPLSNVVDDSYFQYHFLAQVAHRIILTRIRHSLYFYCKRSPNNTLCKEYSISNTLQLIRDPSPYPPSMPNFVTNSNSGATTFRLRSNSLMQVFHPPTQHQETTQCITHLLQSTIHLLQRPPLHTRSHRPDRLIRIVRSHLH